MARKRFPRLRSSQDGTTPSYSSFAETFILAPDGALTVDDVATGSAASSPVEVRFSLVPDTAPICLPDNLRYTHFPDGNDIYPLSNDEKCEAAIGWFLPQDGFQFFPEDEK